MGEACVGKEGVAVKELLEGSYDEDDMAKSGTER
jgi:hypothetical protein